MTTVTTASTQNALCIEVQARFQGVSQQVLQLSPLRSLWMGDAKGCDLFVPSSELGAEKAPLILVKEGQAFFCFTPSMKGSAKLEGQTSSLVSLIETKRAALLSDGVYSLLLQDKQSAEISFASGLSFTVKSTEKAAAPKRGSKLDLAMLGYTGGSVLAHGLVMALIFSISPEARSLDLTNFESKNQITKASVAVPEIKDEVASLKEEKLNKGLLTSDKKSPAHNGVMTPRSKGFGTTTSRDVTSKSFTPAGVETIASNFGIVSLIKGGALTGGAVSSALAEGSDNFFGGEFGERPGDDFGNPFGTPKGEGADPMAGNTIMDIDGPAVKNKPGTPGTGVCLGCEGHKPKPDLAATGTPTIPAQINRDEVKRVIKRAMPGIKFCYEQGLRQNAALGGKIRVRFVIASNGSVASSSAIDGIDASVDSCVANKISQLSFPMPEGGNIAEITYPFIFQAAQ